MDKLEKKILEIKFKTDIQLGPDKKEVIVNYIIKETNII